jgi:voltage-gated potassium channel
MDREISRLSGHFIICGAGRVGRSAARELARRPLPFVVVDTSEEKLQKYSSEGWLTLVGDATLAPVLHELRIEQAQGLVAATTTDAINIYIILTARSLNPKIKIIARAAEEDAEKHLLTAGADSVVSPYRFAGYRIAQTFMRPNVVDFFDTAMNQKRPLEIEEVKVGKGARFAGQTLESSRIRQELGVIVLAIKGEHTAMRFNPPPDEVIHVGDHLIAMGDPEGLRKLEESASEQA